MLTRHEDPAEAAQEALEILERINKHGIGKNPGRAYLDLAATRRALLPYCHLSAYRAIICRIEETCEDILEKINP